MECVMSVEGSAVYCAQVCAGGQCGTGPVCAQGIDMQTRLPADGAEATAQVTLTGEQDEAVARAIELGKQQIQQEIAAGRIPPMIADFAALHDFVDANEFGGLCEDDGEWNRLFPRNSPRRRTSSARRPIVCKARWVSGWPMALSGMLSWSRNWSKTP